MEQLAITARNGEVIIVHEGLCHRPVCYLSQSLKKVSAPFTAPFQLPSLCLSERFLLRVRPRSRTKYGAATESMSWTRWVEVTGDRQCLTVSLVEASPLNGDLSDLTPHPSVSSVRCPALLCFRDWPFTWFIVFILILISSFGSKSLIKFIKLRIDVIRRKRNATQKFLKKDVADLLANGLDINAFGRVIDW